MNACERFDCNFSDEDEPDQNTIVRPEKTEDVKPEAATETSPNGIQSKKKKKKAKNQVNGSPAAKPESAVDTPKSAAPKPATTNIGKSVPKVDPQRSKQKPVTAIPIPLAPKSNKRKNEEATGPASGVQNSKKMKFQKQKNHKAQPATNELSENRLKAFGINPKKFKNKIKYGNKDQQQKNILGKKFNQKKRN